MSLNASRLCPQGLPGMRARLTSSKNSSIVANREPSISYRIRMGEQSRAQEFAEHSQTSLCHDSRSLVRRHQLHRILEKSVRVVARKDQADPASLGHGGQNLHNSQRL